MNNPWKTSMVAGVVFKEENTTYDWSVLYSDTKQ